MGFLEGYIYGQQISMAGRLADQEDEIDNVSKKLDLLISENREKISELQDKLREVERDRSYWQSRVKALTEVLTKIDPGNANISVHEKIHAEYLASMSKEEVLINTADNKGITEEIGRLDFHVPSQALSCFQVVYGPAFLEVANRPRGPVGEEPYWKQYVWMIMDQSPQARAWVETVLDGSRNRFSELSERIKITENLKNLSLHYLNSSSYDADADTQSMIRGLTRKDPAFFSRTDWHLFPKGTDVTIRKILPENIGVNEKMMDKDSQAWIESARLYLKKYEAIENGVLLRYPTLETGFMSKPEEDLSAPASLGLG